MKSYVQCNICLVVIDREDVPLCDTCERTARAHAKLEKEAREPQPPRF
jgi:hypothetical protein